MMSEKLRPDVRRAVEIDSEVMHGNPVVAGTRIPVLQLVEELSDGATLDDLIEGYPTLDKERIVDALDFASIASAVLQIYRASVPIDENVTNGSGDDE